MVTSSSSNGATPGGFPVHVRRPPWDQAGTSIRDVSTLKQAMELSQLDWGVRTEKAFFYAGHVGESGGESTYKAVPNMCLIVRDDLPLGDPKRVLGHASFKFKPIQNVDAFGVSIPLQQDGGAVFERAGTISDGRVVWMVLRLPNLKAVYGDEFGCFLVIRNSHDCTSSLECIFTYLNMRFTNVMGLVQNRSYRRTRIRLTCNDSDYIGSAADILAKSKRYFEEARKVQIHLGRVGIDDDFVTKFLLRAYPELVGPTRMSPIAANARSSIHTIFSRLAQDKGMSAYELWNAATQYFDHAHGFREVKNKPFESRMKSIMWETRADCRDKAGKILLDMIANGGDSPEN